MLQWSVLVPHITSAFHALSSAASVMTTVCTTTATTGTVLLRMEQLREYVDASEQIESL